MKKLLLIAGLTLATLLTLTACSSSKNSTGATDDSGSTASMKDTNDEKRKKLNALELPQLSTAVADNEDSVEMVTSKGSITIKLFPEIAPKAVENFMTLAKKNKYDGGMLKR